MRNKKIKIIFRWSGRNSYTLSALIGLLQDRLDPKKFDVVTADTPGKIVKQIGSGSLSILAYSFCTSEFADVSREVKKLKERFGDKLIIISGGPHTTALPESLISAGADVSFIGESEESLPHFFNSLSESKNILKQKIINPLPLQDFNSYPPFAYKINFFTPIEITRGCGNNCSFCQTPRIFTTHRERDVDHVKKYALLMKKAGRDVIYFIAPDALSYGSTDNGVNLALLEQLFKELKKIKLNINFGIFPSEISPKRLVHSPSAALLLKKYLKNRKIIIGGQSASEKVLKIMRRDHSPEDIVKSVKILKENGLSSIVDILFGLPGEAHPDRVITLKMMNDLVNTYRCRFNIHYFMPLPATTFHNAKPEPLENDVKNEIHKLITNGHADSVSVF